MTPKLILMFTLNDMTVPDAIEYFEQVKDLPVDYFGYKELGLEPDKMQILNDKIHDAGFESFMEVVEYEEKDILPPAKMAVDMGFDYLMGTVYFPSIWKVIKGKIKYFPFCGKIYDRPSILDGTIEEIAADAIDVTMTAAKILDNVLLCISVSPYSTHIHSADAKYTYVPSSALKKFVDKPQEIDRGTRLLFHFFVAATVFVPNFYHVQNKSNQQLCSSQNLVSSCNAETLQEKT